MSKSGDEDRIIPLAYAQALYEIKYHPGQRLSAATKRQAKALVTAGLIAPLSNKGTYVTTGLGEQRLTEESDRQLAHAMRERVDRLAILRGAASELDAVCAELEFTRRIVKALLDEAASGTQPPISISILLVEYRDRFIAR